MIEGTQAEKIGYLSLTANTNNWHTANHISVYQSYNSINMFVPKYATAMYPIRTILILTVHCRCQDATAINRAIIDAESIFNHNWNGFSDNKRLNINQTIVVQRTHIHNGVFTLLGNHQRRH